MSRREYDRIDDRSDYYARRPRGDRDYEELDVDITRTRRDGGGGGGGTSGGGGGVRRSETIVKDREVETRRGERSGRQLDFLEEDYVRPSGAGQLVVKERREMEIDDEVYSRGGRTVRDERIEIDDTTYRRGGKAPSRRPPRSEAREEVIFRERSRSRPLRTPYPPSENDYSEKEEVIFRERSRGPPARAPAETEEKIDIRIRERERDTERPASRPPPPRSDYRETDVEEIRFRRSDDRRGPPTRSAVDEKITFRETIDEKSSRGPPPRSGFTEKDELVIRERRSSPERRGRDVSKEEIKIDIRERSAPAPRQRSLSRGALVARKEEEWIVRRPRTPSPSPPPPPRDFEKEEIIIRRKTRSVSPVPEPPREPTPEPPKPPPLEPIYRPPIIQEVITHHRHIDHGYERAPSPPPPPAPPSPPTPPAKEENLEIEIKRTGTRNGKRFDEDIVFEQDISDRKDREVVDRQEIREVSRRRSVSPSSRRAPSRYDDDVSAEAEYYNRKVSSRGYPGEAYNGATRDWGLMDVPPGTEHVRMDGAGGGRQEVYWDRYAGERRGKFVTGDRVYEESFGGAVPPPPPPPADRYREDDVVRETKITEKRIIEDTSRGKTRDRMWTEVTKDLVIREAIEEMGYDYEETEAYFYILEYLRYENVLRLVELTEDFRRERRERLREIRLEREQLERAPKMLPPPPVPAPPRSRYDERFYERDYHYEHDTRRRR